MTTIDVPVQLNVLVGSGHQPMPLNARLMWTSLVPIEVLLIIDAPRHEGKAWHMSRDLLTAGLHGRVGEGDVRVGPHPTEAHLMLIDLSSPDGAATLTLERRLLGDMLRSTWIAVDVERETEIVRAAFDAFNWAAGLDDTGAQS